MSNSLFDSRKVCSFFITQFSHLRKGNNATSTRKCGSTQMRSHCHSNLGFDSFKRLEQNSLCSIIAKIYLLRFYLQRFILSLGYCAQCLLLSHCRKEVIVFRPSSFHPHLIFLNAVEKSIAQFRAWCGSQCFCLFGGTYCYHVV